MKNWVRTTIMCAMLTAPLSLTAATASAQVGYGTSGGGAYVCRQVHSGVIGEMNPAQADSVVRYVRADLLKNESFQGVSDEERQVMYESLAMTLNDISRLHINAKRTNDSAAMRRARAEAGRMLQNLMGISPEKVQVTPTRVIFP